MIHVGYLELDKIRQTCTVLFFLFYFKTKCCIFAANIDLDNNGQRKTDAKHQGGGGHVKCVAKNDKKTH